MIPEKYREDEDLVRRTIEQLNKDFGPHLQELRFSGNRHMLFEELVIQVSAALKLLRSTHPLALKSVLYRADVREIDIPASLSEKDIYALSEKIIKREFQKVLTRRFFSDRKE
jgi:hypothetical protein